jgi:hypothetical protein
MGLGSCGYFVTGTLGLNITVTDVISSMGHPRLDSVRLLMMEGNMHIRGTDVVLQVLRDTVILT